MKTVIGSESQNIIKTLSFDDEQATPQLNELKEKYPANLIVVSGELTIDLPDKIDNYDTNTKTFNLSGNRLTFNNCLLENAICRRQHCVIAVLEGQYAIGGIEVTIIYPHGKYSPKKSQLKVRKMSNFRGGVKNYLMII